MFISGIVITGSAVAGSAVALWGVNRHKKKSTLVDVMAPRIGLFGKRRKSLVETLTQQSPPRPEPKKQVELLLKEAVPRACRRVDDSYQAVIHNTVDRMFGTHYQKHLQALGGATGADAIPPIVKQRNREAGFAGLSLVLVLTGVPILTAGSFAINLYLTSVIIKLGLQDMWQKRRLTVRGRNSLFTLGILFSGFLTFQSLLLMIEFFHEKIIATVQGHSHDQLANVFGELPQTVSCVQDGVIVACPLTEIEAGDVVVVRAGEVIPVDGEIITGYASIDQHALTGEAQPYEAESGDRVFASTMVLMGDIRVQVAQASTETLAAQITDILNNTRSHHTKLGLRGLEIADNWIHVTTAAGLLALPFWGLNTMFALWLVPVGALLTGTTPLTLMAYLDMSARSHILVKDGRSLDLLSSIDTVLFDKTGTLTLDQPTVCGIHRPSELGSSALGNEQLLALAAAIEQRQSHPIAAAIRDAATQQGLTLPAVDETRVEVGYGLAVMFNDQRVQLGSQRYMTLSDVRLPDDITQLADERQKMGHSMVYLAMDGVLQGVIELQPTVRPEAKAVVTALHERGIELAMITGDQEAPAQALAQRLGIDRVFANVLPEQKAELVRDLQEQGRQAMFIGDGINDSIALKEATVSVSISGATTVATDTAQIVLMDGTLAQLDALFELSKRYERDMKTQYILGVHVPAAHMGAIAWFGMGLMSTLAIGFTIVTTTFGVAFRPIWRQETLESKLERQFAWKQLTAKAPVACTAD